MKTFLRPQIFRDHQQQTVREPMLQERGKEGLRSRLDRRARQNASLLQTPEQSLPSGSLANGTEQFCSCRRGVT
jgi:hypothetical protein